MRVSATGQDPYSNSYQKLTGELTDDQQQQLYELLNQHKDLSARSPTDLGRCSIIQHEIDTGEANSIKQSPRRPPKAFAGDEEEVIQSSLKLESSMPRHHLGPAPWST